jgi:hypothetical protein
LFDALNTDSYVQGDASLMLLPWLTLGHSQTYSFITQGITHRVYSVRVTPQAGYAVGIGWDDVAQLPSLSFSAP